MNYRALMLTLLTLLIPFSVMVKADKLNDIKKAGKIRVAVFDMLYEVITITIQKQTN